VGYADVDALFAKRFEEGLAPGLVYGVVEHGEVIHAGAFGTVSLTDGAAPTVDSVFRIASMSKSFTAAALLLLRDRGPVRLDDPVTEYVPELAGHSSGPAITLRSLLTMGAGLLTDDPWGDRQESLADDEFGVLLEGGITVGRAPGLGFEYSNLGYAVLGRVINKVAGNYREFVERELVAPLGMTATRYAAGDLGPALVPGHVKRGADWVELEPVSPGAFSAMGGLHSSVADLARWVHGFVTAFEAAPDGHPLAKASRCEMQQLQRLGAVDASLAGPSGLTAAATGYGMGLSVLHDSQLGHFAMHSGGYPGYGSRMAWHPASGLGVVTLSNGTYAGAYQQADDALRLLVRRRGVATPRPRLAVTADWITTVTARLAAFRPDRPWIDAALMADNVALDTSDDERRQRIADAREQVGAPLAGPPSEPYSRAMAHAAWIVPAERGRYEVEILLTPEAVPRLQTVTVTGIGSAPAGSVEQVHRALAGDQAALVRAFGEPVVVSAPVATNADATEFLVEAGPTWWKATLADARVTFEPHPAAAYPRLAWLAQQLRALAA